MNFNISLARGLIRIGRFIQRSAVMVMTPDQLMEFSRQQYAKTASIEDWNNDHLLAARLYQAELKLLEQLPHKKGQMLLLGLGGGREAIPFAQMGFDVTGVDFIPEMVQGAIANAARHKTQIKGLVQNIATLDFPTEAYDVVWLSASMYSCIPSRSRRVQMLRRVHRTLKQNGYFACQFHYEANQKLSFKGELIRRLMAWLTLGNLSYERGDMLWGSVEFIHAFDSEEELKTEFADGGFDVVWLNIPTDMNLCGEALLQKRAIC